MQTLWADLKPGDKTEKMVEIQGTWLAVPVTALSGTAERPSVLITTGIHGSEYPGTAAMIELGRELRPEDLKGRLAMIHPVNVGAFKHRVSAIMPEDGLNLNRVFPGDPQGSISSRAAWWLTALSDEADFFIDLHSGDLFEELTPYAYYPGQAENEVVEKSRAMARVLDVPYIVRSGALTGAYNSAARRGTPSLLIERGGAGFCRSEEVALYKKDILNLLKHLGLLKGKPTPPRAEPRELDNVIYLESKHEALWRPKVSVGQWIRRGQILGRVFDFFGRTITEYQAEMDGVVLYQLRSLSTNPGDILTAYGN